MTYTPSFINRVQQLQAGYAAGNTDLGLSTAVNPSYTMLLASFQSADVSGFPCGNGLGYATLLNGSTVRIVQAASSNGACTVLVVEFLPQMLRQPVQYGLITLSGVTSATAGITAVGPRAFLVPLGFNENKTSVQTSMASVTCRLVLSSTTLVTAVRSDTGGPSAPDVMVASFCVVDPK